MPKKRNTYIESDVQKALHEIKIGKISKKAASKIFNIPRSTLQFRLGSNFSKVRPGPSTILTSEEEERMVHWIKISQQKGFPKRREDVTQAVKQFLLENDRPHPFGEENMPGKGWFKSFLTRHPSLSFRAPDPVSSASATVAISDINSWFDAIEKFLTDQDYIDILKDPTRIFNGDETNFLLCPKTKNVLAAKGARNVYEVDRGLAKANLTVMFTFSAAGVVSPPMVIYPYKRVPEEIRKSLPKGWGMGVSDNGWMTKEIFYEYISKVLHPYLVQMGTKFPIIYFVDGHATHLTLSVSELCVRLQIILIALYPNATRILQPADVAAFKPLKTCWNNKVLEWRRCNPMGSLTKEKFAPLLFEVIGDSISAETIKSGFKSCGLYPFDKQAIKISKCLGRSTTKSNENLKQNLERTQDDAFIKLCATVGESKLEDLKKLEKTDTETSNYNEDFLLLFDLYKQFKCGINPKQICHTANKSTQTDAEYKVLEDWTIDIGSINEFMILKDQPNQQSQNEAFSAIDATFQPNDYLGNCTEVRTNSNAIPCIVVPSETTRSIDEYLDWPETPLRKGCKPNKIKKPFVVTSPLWIKQEEVKREQKQKIETDKENRKADRIKNKELKELQKKCKPKRARKTNPKQPIKSETHTTTTDKILVSVENDIANEIFVTPTRLDMRIEHTIEPIFQFGNNLTVNMNECFNKNVSPPVRSEMSICEPATEHHIRKLFPVDTTFDIGNNSPASGSMCYNCTFALSRNSSSENFGLKCNKCTREFHLKCIIKLKCNYIPIFICNGCKTCEY